jgi:isopentenyl-diphosphate delta-isomerase
MDEPLSRRKADHLALCLTNEVSFRERTTLLECVHLVHDAAPELAVDEIDPSCTLFGKTLRAPIVIAGMTGGTAAAEGVNRDLARAAESLGLAFGLGSQRGMLKDPKSAGTYRVRDVAPSALLLANLGVVQARGLEASRVASLVEDVGADALCLHFNPAMELVQPEGDVDFRGAVATVERLAQALPVPVIVKETGCGFSRATARALVGAGARGIDVSGAGGTSWVAVESLRAEGLAAAVGAELREWGIPTAASVVACASLRVPIIATGGIRTGLDVARAIALGASAAGLAAPLLRAQHEAGYEGVVRALETVLLGLRTVMLLTGSRTLEALRRAPRVVVGELRDWMDVAP